MKKCYGITEGRTEGRTEPRTDVNQYTPPTHTHTFSKRGYNYDNMPFSLNRKNLIPQILSVLQYMHKYISFILSQVAQRAP